MGRNEERISPTVGGFYPMGEGSIQLFRPDQNAKRLQRTADRLLMPQVPTDMFVDACKAVVKANEEYVPPYGTGANRIKFYICNISCNTHVFTNRFFRW